MKPLDYLSSSTPPRPFQRFDRLEASLGLLSLACATASLLPWIAAFLVAALFFRPK